MKRIFSLLAAAGLILTSAAGASAIDFKAGGSFEMGYQWTNHPAFTDQEYDRYEAATRVNLRFDAIANENLRGVYQARIGTTNWGMNKGTNGAGKDAGWAIGSQGVNVRTLDAYLNFRWPDTNLNLKMGMFKVSTPQAVKGKYSDPTVLGERVAGLEASYVFNKNVAATFNWMRTANNSTGVGSNYNRSTKMDLLMLAVPVKSDFLNITPWGMYGWVGKNADPDNGGSYDKDFRPVSPSGSLYSEDAGANGKIWWTGLALDVKALGNVILKGDVIYGHYKAGAGYNSLVNKGKGGYVGKVRRAGWYGDVQVGYKMDNMTPLLTFWYASGDKNSDLNGKGGGHDSGRMPTLSHASGITSLGGRNNLAGTQFGARDRMNAQGYTGMWGLIAGLEDIKFVDKLTSAFRVAYMRGTNGKDTINTLANKDKVQPWYLAKNDSAWEFNLDNEYKLYKELGLWVDLGYIYLDRNKSNRGSTYENNDVRIFTGFYYNF